MELPEGGGGAIGLNQLQIDAAIQQANAGLNGLLPGWHLAQHIFYQLSNRFAWSWKIASLGMPVVLVYLGFLNADEMPQPFHSAAHWAAVVRGWAGQTVPAGAWETQMYVNGTLFLPVLRAVDIRFEPSTLVR
jgi:hypothetical protein